MADMRSRITSKKTLLLRHLGMASVSGLLVYLFYLSYSAWGVQPALWPDWGEDHPFWRAWAHAAFVLLFLTLSLSPASAFWKPVQRLLPWRRELGIWFAVLAVGHAYAIWDRWARGDFATLFGFQYVEELDRFVLARAEVGIMNMMGMVMLPMIILLAVTSSDRAVNFLGASSWKWIHRSLVHVIFYLAMLRGTLYFFYFFQTTPPQWQVYPSIWFMYVFLGMGVFAVSLQAAAFAKTVLGRKRQRRESGMLTVAAISGVVALMVAPLVLMLGTVAYFDSRLLKENPQLTGQAQTPREDAQTQVPDEYAQSFEMVIEVDGQQDRLWVRDLDDAPSFRLTTQIEGTPVADQIYRVEERTLYVAEQGPDSELTWSRTENVEPEDIDLPEMVLEPGAWAAQFGPGEHRVPGPEGELQVTIHSVDEPIAEEVFEIPEDADPVLR
ncbi:ferric reductase-like transmembrane domain-containing protein [Nesterenkonia sedimenti]|nr:ferric reductase-like transmembrane domain-containing protein [Nesterenkonia sedimenti]